MELQKLEWNIHSSKTFSSYNSNLIVCRVDVARVNFLRFENISKAMNGFTSRLFDPESVMIFCYPTNYISLADLNEGKFLKTNIHTERDRFMPSSPYLWPTFEKEMFLMILRSISEA